MSGSRIKRRTHPALTKKAKRGFSGYPVATGAFYGPDETHASKVAVGIVLAENQEPAALARWFSEDSDVRFDRAIGNTIGEFIRGHAARTVVMADRIIGCPHEEEIDYPLGETCPQCPFWAIRDRWSGEVIQ